MACCWILIPVFVLQLKSCSLYFVQKYTLIYHHKTFSCRWLDEAGFPSWGSLVDWRLHKDAWLTPSHEGWTGDAHLQSLPGKFVIIFVKIICFRCGFTLHQHIVWSHHAVPTAESTFRKFFAVNAYYSKYFLWHNQSAHLHHFQI